MAKIVTGMQIKRAKTTAALKAAVFEHGKAEYRLHCQIIELLDRCGVPGLKFWHTPNGAKRNPVEAAKMRAMGMRRGISDIIIALPDKRMIFIEVKAPTGSLEPEQKEFLAAMVAAGHVTAVVKSFDQAMQLLTDERVVRVAQSQRHAA